MLLSSSIRGQNDQAKQSCIPSKTTPDLSLSNPSTPTISLTLSVPFLSDLCGGSYTAEDTSDERASPHWSSTPMDSKWTVSADR